MTTYHYSVARFVPDPIRGEALNIGVAIASDDPPSFQVRFLDEQQGRRLRQAGFADDIRFIKDLAEEMQGHEVSAERVRVPGGWDLESLREASVGGANSVPFPDARIALHEALPDALV